MILTRADKWLMGILLVLAASGIAASIFMTAVVGEQTAEISVNGKLLKSVPLRKGYREEFRIGGTEHYNIIEINNGHIQIREADCPDQVCVHTGWVSVAPQQIICLPYRVVIKIVSAKPADIDDIAR